MAFWHESNFLMNFKNHIIKWYRLVILPVFHIDNSGDKKENNANDSVNTSENSDDVHTDMNGNSKSDGTSKSNVTNSDNTYGMQVKMPAQDKKGPVVTGDAAAILDRINSDREGRHLDEIEKARKKAEEDARLASIMNANKVDVDSFIAQGKSAAKEAEKKAADSAKEEEMRRAQEIIDRLNREAADDAAKKQAELDAAMAAAAEKFGN